jgi:hypothetical protein
MRILTGLNKSLLKSELLESVNSRTLAFVFLILWLAAGVASGYWSHGMFFALAWLAIASYLIQSSRQIAQQFLDDLEVLVEDNDVDFKRISASFPVSLTSDKFLFFSVPLVLGITALVGLSDIFPEELITLLALLTLGVVFLFAGKGFWGVCVAILYIYKVTRINLVIDSFFPDGKGGFTIPDDFLHKVGWYFFSGGLLLPMAFEFGRDATNDISRLLVAAFLIVFFATGIFAMIIGKFVIILAYESARRRAMRDTAKRMRKLIADGGTKVEIENEAKLQESLEKMSRPRVDRYKFFNILPQVFTAAVPLATYGDEELLEFIKGVFNILTTA